MLGQKDDTGARGSKEGLYHHSDNEIDMSNGVRHGCEEFVGESD